MNDKNNKNKNSDDNTNGLSPFRVCRLVPSPFPQVGYNNDNNNNNKNNNNNNNNYNNKNSNNNNMIMTTLYNDLLN